MDAVGVGAKANSRSWMDRTWCAVSRSESRADGGESRVDGGGGSGGGSGGDDDDREDEEEVTERRASRASRAPRSPAATLRASSAAGDVGVAWLVEPPGVWLVPRGTMDGVRWRRDSEDATLGE